MKKFTSVILKTALVAGCLWFAFRGADMEGLLRSVAGFDVWKLLLTLPVFAVGLAVPGLRWVFLLRREVPLGQCIRAHLLCTGLNAMLPAKAGEVAKVMRLSRHCGQSTGSLVALTLWERFFDLNALLLMGIACAAAYDRGTVVRTLAPLVGAMWLFLLLNARLPALFPRLASLLPKGPLRLWAEDALVVFRTSFRPHFIAGLSVMTAVVWATYALTVIFCMVWALDLGLTVTQGAVFFLLTASAMAVPAAPGGAGLYEAVAVSCLGWFGVDRDMALAAALVTHALLLLPPMLWALGEIGLGNLPRRARTAQGHETASAQNP